MNKRRTFALLLISAAILLALFFRSFQWDSIGINYDEPATGFKLKKLEVVPLLNEYLTLSNLNTDGSLTISQLANDIFHTYPGYFISAKLWLEFFDWPYWQNLRAFSLLWSILTVPLIGLIALRFGKIAAVISVFIALLHPLLQFYGTYIRFYSLYVFISAAAIAMTVWISPWLKNQQEQYTHNKLLAYISTVFLALFTVLPTTIHLGGYIVSFSIFLLTALYLRLSQLGLFYYILTIALGIIPTAKSIFFFYVRATDPGQSSNVMSSSVSHSILSIIFNFGTGIVLTAFIISVIYLFKIRDNKNSELVRDINYFAFALMAAIIPIVLLILAKHSLFRPDYASGLLPSIIALASVFIVKITTDIKDKTTKLLAGITILLLVLSTNLPTFVSNLLIDGDRLDFKEAAGTISTFTRGEPAIVVTDVPGNFKYFTDKWPNLQYIHYKDYEKFEKIGSNLPVFAVLREITGHRNFWFPRITSIDGQIIAVPGKKRLDHRISRFYIIKINTNKYK